MSEWAHLSQSWPLQFSHFEDAKLELPFLGLSPGRLDTDTGSKKYRVRILSNCEIGYFAKTLERLWPLGEIPLQIERSETGFGMSWLSLSPDEPCDLLLVVFSWDEIADLNSQPGSTREALLNGLTRLAVSSKAPILAVSFGECPFTPDKDPFQAVRARWAFTAEPDKNADERRRLFSECRWPGTLKEQNIAALETARAVERCFLEPVKLIICDADETLWGGNLDEDGIAGVLCDARSPAGEVFFRFQQSLRNFRLQGGLLAIASRNPPTACAQALKERPFPLGIDDFAAIRCSLTSSKPDLVEDILQTLHVSPSSTMYIDDNPFHLQEVQRVFPEMSALLAKKDRRQLTDGLSLIASWSSSNQDRTSFFAAEDLRQKIMTRRPQESIESLLQLKIEIAPARTPSERARVHELYRRTNQFNSGLNRYSETEITSFAESGNLFFVSAEDSFGDYGIVSAFRWVQVDRQITIQDWILSCRAFHRRLENMILDWMMRKARSENALTLEAAFTPGSKNQMVPRFFLSSGFRHVEDVYRMDLAEAAPE